MALFSPSRAPLANPAVGQYFFPLSEGGTGTSITHGNGTLRLAPWLVETALKIDRLGAEVTIVGEAGSKVRLGIYSDTGSSYPGALLLDAGQILGDSATVQDITLGATLLLPPALYWIGGAVQSAPTTQPTVRTTSATAVIPMGVGTSLPAANSQAFGYIQTSVSAALPANFTASVTLAGSILRSHVRAA